MLLFTYVEIDDANMKADMPGEQVSLAGRIVIQIVLQDVIRTNIVR